MTTPDTAPRPADTPAAIPLNHEHSRLWDEMNDCLMQHAAEDIGELRTLLTRDGCQDTNWGRLVQQQLERTGDDALIAAAGKLGREWLAL